MRKEGSFSRGEAGRELLDPVAFGPVLPRRGRRGGGLTLGSGFSPEVRSSHSPT